MATVTENDLQEIKDLIKDLKGETTEIKNKLIDMEKGQIRLETELKTEIKGITARLENIEANNRVAIGALFGGIGLAILKLFFSKNI